MPLLQRLNRDQPLPPLAPIAPFDEIPEERRDDPVDLVAVASAEVGARIVRDVQAIIVAFTNREYNDVGALHLSLSTHVHILDGLRIRGVEAYSQYENERDALIKASWDLV
jgi:hypothetical protein